MHQNLFFLLEFSTSNFFPFFSFSWSPSLNSKTLARWPVSARFHLNLITHGFLDVLCHNKMVEKSQNDLTYIENLTFVALTSIH
jgi:hypothetical protein